MATRERHQRVGTAGRNELLPCVCHLGPDLRGCLYKQRIRQKSREFDTVRLVSVDKEDIYLRKLVAWLGKQNIIGMA